MREFTQEEIESQWDEFQKKMDKTPDFKLPPSMNGEDKITTHNYDSEWVKASAEQKPLFQSGDCSHDVIIHNSRTDMYYIGFYCFPENKWIDANTNNQLYNVERWRYFKK